MILSVAPVVTGDLKVPVEESKEEEEEEEEDSEEEEEEAKDGRLGRGDIPDTQEGLNDAIRKAGEIKVRKAH